MDDKCLCCGAIIPEGSHVCPNCKVAVVRDDKMDAYAYLIKYMEKVKPHEAEAKKRIAKRKKPTIKVALDKGATMPTRAYPTDAGLDLYSRETQIVPARESAVFDTGVHIELPPDTAGLVLSKSGLNFKHDLTSEGVIDFDYTGSIQVKLYNNGGYDYKVNAGDKISQLLIVPILRPEPELSDKLEEHGRGANGFGSSGR